MKTSGGLEVWSEGNHETKVRVSSYPEGIGLKLSNEMGQMNVLLLPEDIEPLCRELLDAKAKTQPEEVEYSREWITRTTRTVMPMTDDVAVTISGTGNVASAVGYDVEHVELDAGETQLIRLTFDLWELSASVDFNIDQAGDFIVRFRDEVVRAKQVELEWETDTDPETGIAEECE